MKLGKKPARKDAPRLWLSKYINRSIIKIDAAPRQDFGLATGAADADAWTSALANDTWGDCFWAAAFRALMLNLSSTGYLPTLTSAEATACVLNAYSAATGFNINAPLDSNGDNPTDQGTDALAGMNWLQQHGFVLPDKSVHKIGTYAWVNPQDFEELIMAHNLFNGLYIGVMFPNSWELAPVWDIVKETPTDGHEIIAYSDLAITPEGLKINSWGESRIITRAAIAHYADEIAVAISPDMFNAAGKSFAGFDSEQLLHDQKALSIAHP
jgi:hypothetical protein